MRSIFRSKKRKLAVSGELVVAALFLITIIWILYYSFVGYRNYENIQDDYRDKINNDVIVNKTTDPDSGNCNSPNDFDLIDIGLRHEVEDIYSPSQIADYINKNYEIDSIGDAAPISPDEFLRTRKVNPQDIAVFTAYILDVRGYEAGVIKYVGNRGADQITHLVAIFRDGDVPEYLTVNNNKVIIIKHGWSFADLIKEEEKRTGVNAVRYAFFAPGIINLDDAEWVEVSQH